MILACRYLLPLDAASLLPFAGTTATLAVTINVPDSECRKPVCNMVPKISVDTSTDGDLCSTVFPFIITNTNTDPRCPPQAVSVAQVADAGGAAAWEMSLLTNNFGGETSWQVDPPVLRTCVLHVL